TEYQEAISTQLGRRTIAVTDRQEEQAGSEIVAYEQRSFLMRDEKGKVLRSILLSGDTNGYTFSDTGKAFHDVFKQATRPDITKTLFTTTDLSNLIDSATSYYSQAQDVVMPEFVLVEEVKS